MQHHSSPAEKSPACRQIENRLVELFLERGYRPGDPLPKEVDLSEELGVARSMLREALSRLRMMGLIESRPRRGMLLSEPNLFGGMNSVFDPRFFSMESLLQFLEFRISLEIGITGTLLDRITNEQLDRLSQIADTGKTVSLNAYEMDDETRFHECLYEFSGNQMLYRFQTILRLVLTYVNRECAEEIKAENEWLAQQGLLVSHSDLVKCFRSHDKAQAYFMMEKHFAPYRYLIAKRRNPANKSQP